MRIVKDHEVRKAEFIEVADGCFHGLLGQISYE